MKALKITGARDGMMWYADMIGEIVPYLGQWPEAYKSREPSGRTNTVMFADAEIVEVDAEVDE